MAAAEKLILNTGRQYPVVLEQAFTYKNLDGALATLIGKLPRNATIVGGGLAVTTSFGATTKIQIGSVADPDMHGELDTAAVGFKPLTLTGGVAPVELYATASAALAAGAGVLYVHYVVRDRALEVQPA